MLIEHGCEMTHNDFMGSQLEEMGEDRGKWGYASIQLDGGIEAACVFGAVLRGPCWVLVDA